MKHTLSEWQYFLMGVNFVVGSALLKAPLMTAMFAKQDAWLSMMMTTACGMFLLLCGLLLYRRYNYAFFFAVVEHVAGRWVGGAVNVFVIFLSLHTCAMVVRNFSNFLTVIMPESSPWVFQWMILLLSMYSLQYGASNIGKVNEILSPVMVAFFYGSLLLVANKFSFENLQPVLVNGWKPVVHGAYTTLGFSFIQLMLFSSLMTFVKNKQHLTRISLLAQATGGFSLALAIVFSLGVQGAYAVERETYPVYTLMQDITVIRMFERVEALIGFVWVLAIFIKVVIGYFAAVSGLAHMTRQDNYRPFLLPCGLLIWAMSNQLHPNIVDFTEFIMVNWSMYWLSGYMILLGILAWGIIRKKDRHFRDFPGNVSTGFVPEQGGVSR